MINIKEMSREFNEVEQYLMTIAPSIVSMKDVIEALYVPGGIITEEIKEKLDGYYAQYGARQEI